MFVAGLLPTLGFVPFVFQNYSTVADRYVYLAMLGPALGLAWGCLERRAARRAAPVLRPSRLAALAALSVSQVSYWNDSVALFRHALAICPGRARHAQPDYGQTLSAQGRRAEAIAQYAEALTADPTQAVAHYDLAVVLQRQDRRTAAVAQYRAAAAPPILTDAEAHDNWPRLAGRRAGSAEAMGHLRRALQQDPD